MKRLIPIFALLFAVSAAAYFIYLAQSNAPRPVVGQMPASAVPASAMSASEGSSVSSTSAPGSVGLASTAPVSKARPVEGRNAGQTVHLGSSKSFDGDLFQGSSKAIVLPSKPLFQGGSKAAMIGTDDALIIGNGSGGMGLRNGNGSEGFGRIHGMGNIQGTAVGEQAGAPAVDVRGIPKTKAPASKAPQSAAPASKAPPARNAPPKFMGGSKYDPGMIPLPKRPQSP